MVITRLSREGIAFRTEAETLEAYYDVASRRLEAIASLERWWDAREALAALIKMVRPQPAAAGRIKRVVGQGRRFVRLPGGLRLAMAVERHGQEQPRQSDGVVVVGRLYLPTGNTTTALHEGLQFGPRVKALGEELGQTWGRGVQDGRGRTWRAREVRHVASTWAEAEAQAWAELRAAALQILKAVRRRQLALRAAEGRPSAAKKE